jgi:hypothetical protein
VVEIRENGEREAMKLPLRLDKALSYLALAGIGGMVWAGTAVAQDDCSFVRGNIFWNPGDPDTNIVDMNDGVRILAWLFLGETNQAPCPAAADVNDNGLVELSDYVYLARWIFDGGPPPPAPYPAPGTDPTPGTTVSDERDPRFTFKIGDAIGFASNTGLIIPLLLSNDVPVSGFQMAFKYDGNLLRIDEMLPDKTALKDASAEYIIHQAFNRPGESLAEYSTLIDFATPFDFRTLPAGQDQIVGRIVVSISLIADPGETLIEFVDGQVFPGNDPPEKRSPLHNLVILNTSVARPQFENGKVTIRKAFIRADANQDKRVDISDTVYTLSWIFQGTAAPKCMDAADVNNDSRLDISDAIFALNYLFVGGPQPSSPFPVPGVDPDFDTLDCGEGD